MRNEVSAEVDRKWLELSLAQQSVWLDAKLSGSSVYQLGGWARIAAPVDEEIVRQSISLLMARHDGLRLRADEEMPRQWLDESLDPPMTVIELGSHDDPDAAFRAHVEEVFSSPMPFGNQPLFRIELIRAGKNLNYILWRFHHMIADSASVSITLQHWFHAYEALASDTPQDLAPPSSYLKTIAADAAYLESAAYQKDLAYWADRFDPLPDRLIADLEARPNGERHVPSMEWTLAGDAFVQFQNVAREAGTSAQRALFALFALALGRRYGQSDIVSGVALHRRDLSNRHALGMMAGVIAVRCNFEPSWSLEECVQAFSEQLDADLRHQRLPVDILSRSLGLSGTGRAGLFEVAMSYIPAERGPGDSGLEGLPVTIGMVATKEASPISLHATECPSEDALEIRVAVNTDFLDAGEAGTVASLLEAAVGRFVNEPTARFEDLDTVSARERKLVVEEWNRTESKFEKGTLDGLFAQQAARTPDAVAIVDRDGRQLSYQELDWQSTRLARRLVADGVRPECVVGVRMERSTETIVALLAILKAGGVYLPLDPAYPAERLEYMSRDAGAILILDSVYGLEGDAELPEMTDPARLAYVIYTSGTTGQPKGVAVPHSAAVNMALARRACHDPLGVGDRVLGAISVGFDVSIGQLLLPLLSGATVVIADELKKMGAAEFWSLLAERRVTHINSVPSFIDSILDAAPQDGKLSLKRLMLGGEALTGALVSRIQRALPGVEVVNMYGPTEACIDATYHVATAADRNAAVLPIGRPLSNYEAYILDGRLNPVGVGVTGELYLGGAGLARGYVDAPDLTSERFVADPFGRTPGSRLYRTGDRARRVANGEIEFLGRVDSQVKIRGFRVEPGEIAAALLGHESVSQAVVVPRSFNSGKSGGQTRLVAYYVPSQSRSIPDAAMLRAYLAQILPDYMVPAAFVPIAVIPLNRNGKLDRNALPSPDQNDGDYVAPRTPTEARIAELFAEVLGLDRCGATDHFFELGGHSLLATSLVSKMRSAGMNVALRNIFETPTVEALARRIDFSPRALRTAEPIVREERPEDIPLSLSQERIWFVDRLQQDSSYNIPIAFELRGKLDVAAAERAMERIVARHEALRTRIAMRNGRPVQEIVDAAPIAFQRLDVSESPAEIRESKVRETLAQLTKHRFDLAADAPFQLLLLTLEERRYLLAAVIHHVAFDGWSAGIFLSEFTALYTAFIENGPDPLPSLAIQYADFVIWQRRQNWDADLAYWLEELQDAPPQLELARRSLRLEDSTRLSGTLPIHLDAPLHSALLKLAYDNGASLFMVLHATFALLLSRWSGQNDVVIGTVTANRNRGELEAVIGCFVNMLALRTTFEADETFERLLARVKSCDLAAYAHQDLPFEQLVEALHPQRSLQDTPIFQVLFALQNAPLPELQLPGLVLQPVALEAETTKFDLTLSLAENQIENSGGLSGVIEFAANRFESETMQRFATQYRRLLEAVAGNPEQDAFKIDLLDAGERALVVERWSGREIAFPKGTLDGLFADQVRRSPDGVAVVDINGNELTYAELDARSTSLARYLVGQGVCPERVVGVRMPRSADSIIAFLAILKAGGVYLPLDPAYPADRLAYMDTNAGAMLILESIQHFESEEALARHPDPDHLAYIIYTSGTTGQPKGVAVPHSAAVNLVFARNAGYDPLGPGDRILAVTSVSFDVSVGQLLFPLLKGATVVIAGDVKTMGARGFWEFVYSRRVTHVNFVPSFVDSILDSAQHAGPLHLKRLLLGGEALSGSLLSRIQRTLPGLEVVNIYGPTETCIDATSYVAQPHDAASAVLPIGQSLANYRAYILDKYMQPVGAGVIGELYLGGAGVARGYIAAPSLTAERFIADPFSATPGSRMYRTGDRARWRTDGVIEFLGRADEQVKIRGFRVEPGEIESQLRKQPGVREAAVVASTTGSSSQLIAYYTSDGQNHPDVLRASMAVTLPDYMVPAAFVKLQHLPLSPNGKLDRKVLPVPEQTAFVSRAFEAPQGDIEQKMALAWAELLKVDRVGRHDNFFELGGHSLLAVTLMERMQQQGLPGDVRALFTTPTIAGLAANVQAAETQSVAPANGIAVGCARITPEMLPLAQLNQSQIDRIVGHVPGGIANVQDIYSLSPLQEGILFQYRTTTEGDPYLTPILLGFDTRARLDSFLRALNQVVQRHDVLRTSIVYKELDSPIQVVQRRAVVRVEQFTPAEESDASAQLLAHYDPQVYRLDLGQAPLLRAEFAFDHESGRWLLLMLTHHLILDHTSMEILVHELRMLMADEHASLPPSLPYRNFIAQTLSDVAHADHEAFFKRLLGDIDEPTAPFGLLDLQTRGGHIVEGKLEIAPELARRIRAQARALGVTPASFFHLAWTAVLGHLSGKTAVVFGTVLFGRMRSGSGADRVVGMFINTLPFRLDLDETGVADSVIRTHQLLAELMVHEHAPLALAQRCSALPAPAPLFSSLFNYRYSGAENTEANWPGVDMVHAAERTNYPLAMAVDDSSAGFVLTALAHTAANPEPVCGYLEHALAGLVDLLDHAPKTPFCALGVLPLAERNLVVEEWNGTAARFETGTLDGLFVRQAKLTPEAVAVVGGEGTELTYAELDAQSTRLARHLVGQGVRPESVVGVRMERSTETIVALLAILKAGGVYLPLDPAYPAERLEYMATDAGAMLILDSIDGLDGDAELPELNDPARLAYIIYTSGTTGQPKGVAVAHSAAVNMAFARRACHDPLSVGDRVLGAISVGFDVSIGQLLLPLLSGATVVIAGEVKNMGAAEFWSLLCERRVTHINSVPSFFDSILSAVPRDCTLNLKRLMLGGEALSGALVGRIQRALPGVEVVNMYGPTEACIDATYHVATEHDLTSAVLPIGRPLSNYQAYVLDDRLDAVGVGVTGELYLGGAGLARGYVHAPELTGERFISDPFSTIPGARLYRTGDRARWRADGEIEFLGRIDTQIKIRGFRVEPGEIESQLRKQPGVREAAVVVQTAGGDSRLIAYYTGEQTPDIEALRRAMAAVLPDYMVPAALVKLDRLPLSPNGKLDRKTLPVPTQNAFVARSFEAPQGEIEQRMAVVWAELLNVDRVGRHDNFFELGGHSLLAVTLIERMRRQGLPGDVRSLFTSPTIAGLAGLGLPDAQAAAPENGIVPGCARITPEMLPLVKLTQSQINRIAGSVPGGAANVQDIYSLAPLQEGILFQHLIMAEGDPYLTPCLLSFDKRDRLDSFLLALNQLVQRHDVLRTAMVWQQVEEPVQVVLRRVALPVEDVAIEDLKTDASGDVAEALLSRFDARNFKLDLEKAPLLRTARTYDRQRDRWLLLMLTHHLILDHTSLEILVDETRTLMADPEAVLPVPLPYRNFIAQTKAGATAEEHEAFFTQLLGSVEETTAPFDLLNIQSSGEETLNAELLLNATLSRRLREQARVIGVTPASLFHLAWAAVLGHVSGKSDVVFGTVLFGRMRSGAGADRVVGMFINTLPIRLQLDDTGAADSVVRTHQLLAELMVHEHTPLALAQRCSSVPAPTPLFSSLFNYRYNLADDGGGGWPGVEMVNSSERTNYPLAMAVDDSGSSFVLRCIAQSPADPRRICGYFENALAELAGVLEREPQSPIEKLRVLPSAERELVVEQWNQTDASFETGTLDGLFVRQAMLTPDAIAIVGRDGAELTYRGLNEQSTRLARQLVALGVCPERVVGVRMERSADTIVALLAILKAGGVYLPLDPAYPSERLEYMAADAGAVMILDSVHGLAGDAELAELTDASRLAYIIYTSGTTGQPKGVAVGHSAAVNMAFARRACHDPLGVGDRVLGAISVGFDVSIGQLLLPLLSGATVVIAGDVKTMGAAEFWSLLAERRVTHINSVPSYLDSVLEAVPQSGKLNLKRLMLGGEALSGALVGRIQRALPGVEVVNMYGPTEACIDATYHVANNSDLSAAILPIGRPLSNYQAYILDTRKEPVGVGVVGELYLGGAGLARGYLNGPDLTAERFVSDLFRLTPGGRLYRTGDRARWRADGEIEFLGRADAQVKIRGFRVEPGEIASALLGHPSVGQAVVVPRSSKQGGKHGEPLRLVAYVVPKGSQAMPEAAVLRAYLAKSLPDYMIPAAFIQIPEIPLNRNGKLDRSALPCDLDLQIDRVYTSPRDSLEVSLQTIFQTVLGVSPISVRDSFFELGGDSLGAMRLINALNTKLNVNLPMRLLFERPTIEELALSIRLRSAVTVGGRLVPLQPGGSRRKLFCIHPVGGHVFCYLPLMRELGPDQPVFGLQARGLEEGEQPAASIEEMAAEYVEAIVSVQPEGPYQLLGMSSGGVIAFEMARQIKQRGGEVSSLVLLDTTVPSTSDESTLSEELLLRAMAAELGCNDLMDDAPATLTLAQLVDRAHRAGRLPADFSLSHAERIDAVSRNTKRAQAEYRPGHWDGPMMVIRATQRLLDGDTMPDWSTYTTDCLAVVDIDCRHSDLVSQELAPTVAALVARGLNQNS